MQIPHALRPVVGPVQALVTQVIDDDVPDLAAGLAYRFLFALFPFALFLAALAAFVAGWTGVGDPTSQILGAVGDNLPPDIARQLAPQLEAVLGQARPGLLSVGALLALWAATGGIGALMKAMNQAYDVRETRGFVKTTAVALVLTLVGSIGILIAFVTVVGGSILTEQAVGMLGIHQDAWSVIGLVRYPVMLALVAIAVATLFRYGPNVAVSFRWTFVGGLVFAIGWIAVTALFGLYVANFGSYANTYGALGGVVVLMLWFYLTALLLLVAAEITSMLATSHEPDRVASRREETGAAASAADGDRPAAPEPRVTPEPTAAAAAGTPPSAAIHEASTHEAPTSVTQTPTSVAQAFEAVSRDGQVSWRSRIIALVVLLVVWLLNAMAGRRHGDKEESGPR